MKIKIPNTELQLTIVKGNKKPIPQFVWIVSMQSSTDCISRKKGLCKIGEDCYGLVFEENPIMQKTVDCRRNDEIAFDYLVDNKMHEWFAEELLKRNERAKTHKMRYLRWNATGDCKTLEHLLFVDRVADILYEKAGVVSSIYTHRVDIWVKFRDVRQSKYLIVNGSNFPADNNFKAVREYSEQAEKCSSNCVKCFNEDEYFCYNLDKKGSVIEEIFRERKNKARR